MAPKTTKSLSEIHRSNEQVQQAKYFKQASDILQNIVSMKTNQFAVQSRSTVQIFVQIKISIPIHQLYVA